jgi:hypothetical protein
MNVPVECHEAKRVSPHMTKVPPPVVGEGTFVWRGYRRKSVAAT